MAVEQTIMEARIVGIALLAVWAGMFAAACEDDSCKKPMRISGTDPVRKTTVEGTAVQCNLVMTCPKKGGGDKRIALTGGNDRVIVDRGSDKRNEDGCKQLWLDEQLELFPNSPIPCTIEAFPSAICLDVDGGAGGPGPSGGPGDPVTVGVGAAAGSGDFLRGPEEGVDEAAEGAEQGTEDGAGRARRPEESEGTEEGEVDEGVEERTEDGTESEGAI
jgi:hypothetical protein